MNGLRQWRDATGGHQVGWKSPTIYDGETASQQRGEEGQTGIEVQCNNDVIRLMAIFHNNPVKQNVSILDFIGG